MNIIDLTHNIENGMMIYPGDPEIAILPGLTHEKDYCHVDRLNLNSHTGTHIDAPLHFIPGGKTITDYPAGKFIADGIAVDLRGKGENEAITARDLENAPIFDGCAVIIVTGWYEHFGTEKYLRHPFLSEDAARFLVDRGASIVAVDFLNVDSTVDVVWNAHPVLLGNDTLIVENLSNTLSLDFKKRYLFSFLPLKVVGTDGSPVRAVAIDTADN